MLLDGMLLLKLRLSYCYNLSSQVTENIGHALSVGESLPRMYLWLPVLRITLQWPHIRK